MERSGAAMAKRALWALGLTMLAAAAAHADTADRAALMKQHRGGVMRLVARGSNGTIDPHVAYSLQYWQMDQSVYDGLTAFKKAQGAEAFKVVPDLAADMPRVTNDGRTYTFTLRRGIKFSNGQEVTTKDVVASFQRIFKVIGPNSGTWYAGIVGADLCLKTPATCTLAGGVAADEAADTVTFNLTAPDAEFLDKLAVPHATISPAATPPKDQGNTPVPGTGPYMIASFNPSTGMVLTRNPYFKEWSVDAEPDGYPDRINYDIGLEDEAQVTAVENGQADWTYDPVPADRLAELGGKFAQQTHLNPLTAIYYLPLNVNLPPFDNLKARQALAFALDRRAAVNLFGGRNLAVPVCQILPPTFPGHVAYCPYTKNPGAEWSAPDMDRARALVKESGTAGQKVSVIVQAIPIDKNIGTYVTSVLRDLGYAAELHPISPDIQTQYIQNSNNHVQISLTAWYQDYPAASDFLNVLFSCANFHPGSDASINESGVCDHALDARMQHALATGVADPEAANKEWAAIDRSVTDQAYFAVLFAPKHVDFVAKRVGNFVFSSQFYWLFTQSWVQ